MFRRHRKKSIGSASRALKDLVKMESTSDLLADKKRQTLLKQIRENTAMESAQFENLVMALINQLVNYYQNLPETNNSYYAQLGGLLDHALNRTEAALNLFKKFVLLEDSSAFSEKQKLWQYALLTAALIKGIGKIFTDLQVNIYDKKGQALKVWNPLLEDLVSTGSFYDYEFEKESEAEFRRRLNLLLAKDIMPTGGYAWIASDSEVLKVWLALINEDPHSAGTLGAILIRADAIAIQRYFQDWLVGYGGGGRRRRVGSFRDTSPDSISDKEQWAGIEFINWLKQALADGLIQLNKAPLFMVPGGMLMSPEIFKLFVREHSAFKSWQAVENGFLALGLHQQMPDGSATTRYEQMNNQQIHQGVVYSDYAVSLPAEVQVKNVNTGKSVTRSAMDVIHSKEFSNQFVRSQIAPSHSTIQHLSSNGKWQQAPSESSSPKPGAKRGG